VAASSLLNNIFLDTAAHYATPLLTVHPTSYFNVHFLLWIVFVLKDTTKQPVSFSLLSIKASTDHLY
jgi:hypothetical protein